MSHWWAVSLSCSTKHSPMRLPWWLPRTVHGHAAALRHPAGTGRRSAAWLGGGCSGHGRGRRFAGGHGRSAGVVDQADLSRLGVLDGWWYGSDVVVGRVGWRLV